MIDIQKLIAEKMRFTVEVDVRMGGYIDSAPDMQPVAQVVMKDLTKDEAEMAVRQIINTLSDIEEELEPDEIDD